MDAHRELASSEDSDSEGMYPSITTDQAVEHLRTIGYETGGLAHIGAGHWSVCFGFSSDDRPLVVRYGHQRNDFDLDRAAFRFHQQGLPVPEVLDIGRAFAGQDLDGDKSGCWYAVSERVFGEPLEQVSATQWSALVPAVATSMEKMRLGLPPAAIGWGGWASVSTDGAPIGRHPSWREHLLAVIDEPNDGRIAGWRDNLRANRERQADFDWGFELLDELTGGSLVDSVVRGISHQDMLNRNVHVSGSRITGLFDWGCAAYADHLYELSLFEFWNPWHPEVDVVALRAELEANWQRSGFTAERVAERLRVCHLHNGLVHLMYGAYLENWDTLWQTAERMRDLVGDD